MRNHIAFKFIAILLCAAMLALSLGCGAAIIVLAENGLFDRDIEEMRQERLQGACWDLSYYLVGDYVLRNLSNCSESVLEQTGDRPAVDTWYYSTYAVLFEDGEWFYTLADAQGNILEGSHRTPAGLTEFEATLSWEYPVQVGIAYLEPIQSATAAMDVTQPQEDAQAGTVPPTPDPAYDYAYDLYDEQTGTVATYFFRTQRSPEYTVTLYLTENAFPIYSAADWQLLEFAQTYRYHLMGALAASLLLFAVFAVYLCCAAGRKPGTDAVKAEGLNRIPIDLYALGVFLGLILLVSLLRNALWGLDYSANGESFLPMVILIAAVVYIGCLMVVAFCFAFAAQVKTSDTYWLRHSATGWCLIQCWKLLVAIFRWVKEKAPPFFHKLDQGLEKGAGWLWKTTKLVCIKLWAMTVFLAKRLWKFLCFCDAQFVRFVHWLGRAINRFFSLLPLTWQWLLTGFALVFMLYLSLRTYRTGWLLLGFGVFFAVILYGAHAFGILMESAKRMSKGDLDTKLDDRLLVGSFQEFAVDLNALADVVVVAAQKQMKSERMKAELVTNVSHDIKTPLTSIINYVDLMQKAESQEEAEEYLEVLARQSQRLKKLIEDLMEMSKASTGNLHVEIGQVDAAESINQSLGEFADKLAAAQLTPIFNPPQAPIYMRADGRLAWRVLSNLLSNAVKYALPGTRLYIDLVELEGKVLISLKNISKEQLNVSSEELMERFVRGDASRNTEGSGLGLNIAKSLMDLQHGQLQLLVDGDLFKATLIFPGI